MAREIVVLGGPNSGKTHFTGQLYGRLQRCPGALRLRRDSGTPSDLSPFEEVLSCLEKGCAAGHTATETWEEVHLPLIDVQGQPIDLWWPDYGGEQIRAVTDDRSVSGAWRARLKEATGWLLFIRLTAETTYPDALKKLTERTTEEVVVDVERASNWDANARLVELLQILLHVAGVGTVSRVSSPRLAVLLSCYDELSVTGKVPREMLGQSLPLLASFIEANWEADSVTVWGLSSLGRTLQEDSSDDAFIDEGPELQGWVVPADGSKTTSDLSQPLVWALGHL